MSYEVLDPEKPEPKRDQVGVRYNRLRADQTLNPNRAGFVGMVVIYHAAMEDVIKLGNPRIELGQPLPMLVTFVHGTESHADSALNGYVFFDGDGMVYKRGVRRGDGAGQWGFSNLTGTGFLPGTPDVE